jgi:uncharacterized protein YcaQ
MAASSLGIFAEEDVAYLRKDGIVAIGEEIAARVEDSRLIRVAARGIENRRGGAAAANWLVRPEALAGRRTSGGRDIGFRILSPFDPLIIDRRRTSRLFGRSVQLECYLPSSKRSFGYFALPILALGGAGGPFLAGLLDAKAERRDRRLVARRLSLDAAPRAAGGTSPGPAAIAAALAAALTDFAAFNSAHCVELERFEAFDGRIERSLKAALARLAR